MLDRTLAELAAKGGTPVQMMIDAFP